MTGLVIFLVVYALISARRLAWLGLDRPAAVLAGATAMVAFGVLAPDEALAAVDTRTIVLLFGVMAIGAALALDGFFERAADYLPARAGSASRLIGVIVWGSGALSAVITNDAVCVLGAPLVVSMIRRHGLPATPFLLALATGANTGSVATLVGNPQNMLCASLGGLSYGAYSLRMLPVVLVGLAINHGLLWLMFRRQLAAAALRPGGDAPHPIDRRVALTLVGIAGTVVVCLLGGDLAWTAVGGAAALLVLHRREPGTTWAQVDWSVLLFFAGLFVVVEGLVRSGAPAWVLERVPLWTGDGRAAWSRVSALFLVGSNVVSNVPFILVVEPQLKLASDPTRAWTLLAMTSTFAGNLTLLGSVANIIVAERGREVGGLGFWAYLRVGLPLSLLTTAVGAAWLWVCP